MVRVMILIVAAFLLVSNSLCQNHNITVGVLLPWTGFWNVGKNIGGAVSVAVDYINSNQNILPNKTLQFVWKDTGCHAKQGLKEAVNLWSTTQPHAFIGGGCDEVCEPVGLLASSWNIPMVSWGCTSSSLSRKFEYDTFSRTVGPYTKTGPMFVGIMKYYNWARVAILSSTSHMWQLTSHDILLSLEEQGVEVATFQTFDPGNEHIGEVTLGHTHMLEDTMSLSRIIIICSSDGDVRDIMLAAFDLNMINGDYVFLTIGLRSGSYIGRNTWMGADGRDVFAQYAFRAILNINVLTPHTPEYNAFVEDSIKRLADPPFNYSPMEPVEVNLHAGRLYDAVLLYAIALTEELQSGGDEHDGKSIALRMRNMTFQGISGEVVVDEYGDCDPNYSLQVFKRTYFDNIADYHVFNDTYHPHDDGEFVWLGNRTEPPKDYPPCGWNGEYCPDNTMTVIIAVVSALCGVVILGGAGILIVYRRLKLAAELATFALWKVNYCDIVFSNICTSMRRSCRVLSRHCSKSTIQDVLENENIKLDDMFKLSIATDICKGMLYLHNSTLRSHGRLKSSNCVIDSRWVCKITDYGMGEFRNGEEVDDSGGEYARYSRLLWTAPEHLRFATPGYYGSPEGDVYAFGVILSEIVTREGPFATQSFKEPRDIIEAVKAGKDPVFRPLIPVKICKPAMHSLMKKCWAESPADRPNSAHIIKSLNSINGGRNVNIVDNMIAMMAKYTEQLEEVVEERTSQLYEEKQRTDELLNRMLPRQVQQYDIQNECVIDLLNDLYSDFDDIIDNYDVYKVETIGDAYMCASGLPEKNGHRHAGEIATMALELLSSLVTFKIRHIPGKQLQLRIGIHTGPVVAGVVGLKMPRYCLFGDTVNTASRMESSGLALRINISSTTATLLRQLGNFVLEERGQLNVKGKEPIMAYWLKGRSDKRYILPDLSKAATLEDTILNES
ncbi:atrial natriuretic peptide receptor 1-like [Saccoglossus kowalevskii]